jgi:hypothetical protein
MNPRNLSRAELADFIRNAATAVADGKVPGLLPDQVASFSDALTNVADSIAEADGNQVAAVAAASQTTQIAQTSRFDGLELLQDLKYAMKSAHSPASAFDAVGFDPPAEGRSIITPQAPTQLAAAGYSNGVNVLRFTGNNVPGTVHYLVEARTGDDPEYRLVGISTKQIFRHFGVVPGRRYRYRIRAQASRNMVSTWSNEAVVYGVQSGNSG